MGPNALNPKIIDTSVWEHNNFGWMHCDGRPLLRGNYRDLLNAIGDAWGGIGDPTFFNLPDLQGYFLRGVEPARDKLVDPDREARTPNPHPAPNSKPGNKGPNVGSYQSFATARPPISITKDGSAHIHSLRFQLNASRDRGIDGANDNTVVFPGVHDPMGTNEPFVVDHGHGDLGEHTHGITGGDSETRPVNAYVHWIIRVFL
jgi:hypothetical protein